MTHNTHDRAEVYKILGSINDFNRSTADLYRRLHEHSTYQCSYQEIHNYMVLQYGYDHNFTYFINPTPWIIGLQTHIARHAWRDPVPDQSPLHHFIVFILNWCFAQLRSHVLNSSRSETALFHAAQRAILVLNDLPQAKVAMQMSQDDPNLYKAVHIVN